MRALGRRIAFTLGALLVYRIGAYIPLPGTDIAAWSRITGLHSRGLFGVIDMPAGAPARHFAIFALGILPYITAAILVQIACMGSARLRALSAAAARSSSIRFISRWRWPPFRLMASRAVSKACAALSRNPASYLKSRRC